MISDGNAPVAVTMTAVEWHNVIALLNETGPYRVVAPLIAKLEGQTQFAAAPRAAQINGSGAHVPD